MEVLLNNLVIDFKIIIECIVILVFILMELFLGFFYYIYFLFNNSKEKIDRLVYYK